RRRHTSFSRDWSSDVCSSDLYYRTGSAASTLDPSVLDHLPLAEAELVHISGITPALSASCSALIDALLDRRDPKRTQVSFDVNRSQERRVGQQCATRCPTRPT